ncbi:nucleoside-diphosphate sugar epimerase [Arenimonas caeni]|uniref:nucleoside-diphosphate sugar epimerase n=1 Tax=Arenimonas caeni TaxID=2058085 RepID=UPI002A3610D8|nr:nucleoside-diphosphate sugar epimerase [Arenimonas caeni]MDY0021812.1 nucleoside-diphosphate sugar epimerase [Arenimonas caeni]
MQWLVFGLTGMVGEGLRAQLSPGDPPLLAVSRQPPADEERVRWHSGALPAPGPLPAADAIASLGPLDAFAHWFEVSGAAPARVVALGSTSVHGKAGSPDPAERELVRTLEAAERRLAAACAGRGCALTLLRPTLVWGRGRDRNLARWVALGRRLRWLPLPRTARGLRQPIHADDVAAAVLAALRTPVPVPGLFDLPGGETLAYDEMVARCLRAGAPGARLLRVPAPLFRAGLALLGRRGPGPGVLARLDQDLAYDRAPVQAALGLPARPFSPTPVDFPDR